MSQQKKTRATSATKATVETKEVSPSKNRAEVQILPPAGKQKSANITPMAYVDDTVTIKLSTGKSMRMSRGAAERWIKDHKNDKII